MINDINIKIKNSILLPDKLKTILLNMNPIPSKIIEILNDFFDKNENIETNIWKHLNENQFKLLVDYIHYLEDKDNQKTWDIEETLNNKLKTI